MSQRTDKVESLVQQTVAQALSEELGPQAVLVTVRAVDVSPDLKQATVWLGIAAPVDQQAALAQAVSDHRRQLQAAVAAVMTTKYVPKLTFSLDKGGEYAQHIEEILRQL